jgi:hypothetical protein
MHVKIVKSRISTNLELRRKDLIQYCRLVAGPIMVEISVTDGGEGICVDPGETGAILEAGGVGGPGPLGGGKDRQLVSDSGGG